MINLSHWGLPASLQPTAPLPRRAAHEVELRVRLQRRELGKPVRRGEQRGDRADIPYLVVGEPGCAGLGDVRVTEEFGGARQRERQVCDSAPASVKAHLPGVGGYLVGELGIFGPDAEDGAVGNDAVGAEVGCGGRDDYKFAFCLGQAFFSLHERVVVVKEGSQLDRAVAERAEDVRNEAGLLRDRANALAQVIGKIRKLGHPESALGLMLHTPKSARGSGTISSGNGGPWVAVTDEAIEKIKAMIVSGTLRAGDRLPKEADLAAELGLSRNSLREAVKALSLVNILDVRQGDGTYVTSLEPTLLLEALSFIVDFHRDATVLELLQVRRILEPAATAMATVRATDDEIDDLRKLLESLGPDPAVEDLIANDLEFHRRIAVSSGNSVLSSLVESMSAPTVRARVWRGLTEAGVGARTVAEHRAILDAMASRDPEAARSWATVHIAAVEQWLNTVL
jgi:GntR family transcriptional regulator, transcriptional repressor for pyruvate dehydrogenase complex